MHGDDAHKDDIELQDFSEDLKVAVGQGICVIYTPFAAFRLGKVYTYNLWERYDYTLEVPTKIPLPERAGRILDVAITNTECACIQTEGGLYVFGKNRQGELGLGHLYPVAAPTLLTLPDNDTSPVLKILGLKDQIAVMTQSTIYLFGREMPLPEEGFVWQSYFTTPLQLGLSTHAEAFKNIYTHKELLFIETDNQIITYKDRFDGLKKFRVGGDHEGKIDGSIKAIHHRNLMTTILTTDGRLYACGYHEHFSSIRASRNADGLIMQPTPITTPDNVSTFDKVANLPGIGTVLRLDGAWYVLNAIDNQLDATTELTPEMIQLPPDAGTILDIYPAMYSGAYVKTDHGLFRYVTTPEAGETLEKLPFPDDAGDILRTYSEPGNTFFQTEDTLYALGSNQHGEFGVGHTDRVATPTDILLPLRDEKPLNVIRVDTIVLINTNHNVFYAGRLGGEASEAITEFAPLLEPEELFPDHYSAQDSRLQSALAEIDDPALTNLYHAIIAVISHGHTLLKQTSLPGSYHTRGRQEIRAGRLLETHLQHFLEALDAHVGEDDESETSEEASELKTGAPDPKENYRAIFQTALAQLAEDLPPQRSPSSWGFFQGLTDPIGHVSEAAESYFGQPAPDIKS